MAKGKQQKKKRMKKYKGKYVTADRLDMSKGGRVKKAIGGRPQKTVRDEEQKMITPKVTAPKGKRLPPSASLTQKSIGQRGVDLPLEKTNQQQAFQAAQQAQQNIPLKKLRTDNQQQMIQPKQEATLANLNINDNLSPQQAFQAAQQAQTGGGRKTTQEQLQSLNVEDNAQQMSLSNLTGSPASTQQQQFQAARQAQIGQPVKSPVEGRPVQPPSIGGPGGGTTTPQPQPAPKGFDTPGEPWWSNAGYKSADDAIADGWYYDDMARQWVPGDSGGTDDGGTDDGGTDDGGTDDGGTDEGGTDDGTTPPPETPLTTQQRAEQIAAGDFSGTDLPQIPDPQKISLEGTELDPTSEAFKMQETKKAEATTVGDVTPETVSTVDAVEKGVVDANVTASTFDAIINDQPVEVQAAIRELTPELKQRITANVKEIEQRDPTQAAKILQEQIEAALAPEVKGQLRPISQVPQVTGEKVEMEVVPEAEVTTRTAEIISEKQKTDILSNVTGEGVNLEDIPQFTVVGQRTAQVAEANTKIAQELGTAPSEDAATRAGITSDGVAKGDAAQIGGIPTFQAASRQAVTGEARKAAAADMLAVVGELPPEVTAAVIENPAEVEAKIDTEPVNVIAAVAALPKEALVSTQMENLLAGIEDNKTPVWARPAVDAVNQMMLKEDYQLQQLEEMLYLMLLFKVLYQ